MRIWVNDRPATLMGRTIIDDTGIKIGELTLPISFSGPTWSPLQPRASPMQKNPTYELLTEAQNLIRDPKHWTRNVYARDENWEEVNPNSDRATCFCSLGALRRAAGLQYDHTLHEAREKLERAVEYFDKDASLPGYNDRHTHAEVMALWDRARELANVPAL